MFSKAHFVKPKLDTPVVYSRPTMVVEVEEPPTLTISSDEIIAFIEKCCMYFFRVTQRLGIAIGTSVLSLYKKLSSVSVHVSFEEIQEIKPVPEKVAKVKTRYPGQLGLFTETPLDGSDAVSKEMAYSSSVVTQKQDNHVNLFWITFIALSFGLAASMFLQ